MKYVRNWFPSLATLAATVALVGSPLTTQTASATMTGSLQQESQAIDIPVPRPERQTNGICPEMLAPAINSIVDNSTFSQGRWGVLVEDLRNDRTLYSRNANAYFIPASNVKLFTTAAALQRFDVLSPIGSTSLGNWVQITNRDSNNGYADNLLRHLGGPQVVKQTLMPLGVEPNAYRQVDGSGLSRSNQAKPIAFLETLKAMRHASGSDVFYSSLPVAGMSGTLRHRFNNSSARGIVRAKTGTLTGVRALSGYVENPNYGTLAFSIMANQSNVSGSTLVSGIDRIVLQMSRLTPCN